MRYFTWFTSGSPYEREAERLIKSAEAVGVEVDTIEQPPCNDWHEAVSLKAQTCLAMLGSDIGPAVLLDADCVMHEDPTPWFADYADLDVAFRFRRRRLLTGTMLLNPTDDAKSLIQRWHSHNERLKREGVRVRLGQGTLQDLVERGVSAAVGELDPRLCWIFDLDPKAHPDWSPVIEHLQASRDNDPGVHSDEQRASRVRRLNELGSVDRFSV